ncbi:MAG: phage portal protein [Betaproteobacteria bacterium]|nr:phage portal protein [Betaproteobacteria bacterium]
MGLRDFFRPKESAADRAVWLQETMQRVGAALHGQRLAVLRQASRSFEAAETPPWMDSWPTTAASINEDLSRQLPTLRARARSTARNDEWGIGYLLRLDDNVLGENGMPLQMRLINAAGNPDKDANDRLEAAFDSWGKDCEVSGMSWRDVESLALAAGPEDGEFLYRYRIGRGVGRYGIQLQVLDPDALDVSLHREHSGNRVRMGVEIDNDGRPLAYWIKATRIGDELSGALTVGRHVRVPAGELRHCFLRKHVGQLRGYPWLSGGARRLWMLHDFEQAAAVASSNAAKRQGFFTNSPDGDAPPGFADTIVSSVLEAARASGKTLTPDEIQALTAAAEKYNTTMPGQFDTLPQGYDFKPFESKWPDVSADSYVKQQLRGWAAARGMSYHTLGNDMEAVNFSSGRIGIGGEREHFKRLQGLLRAWLHEPVFSAVLPHLVLATPKLAATRLPEYMAAPTWSARRWPGIDPVKEATADEINLKNRTTSRRRIILQRGDDPDDLAEEIAMEERLYGPPDAPPRQTDAPLGAKE